MDANKIQIPKEKETYLATVYGKALDASAPSPILGDRYAAEAVARIDYDFRELKLPSGGDVSLPLRALHFDTWTRAFLAANPECSVLHLGCGLDTRVYRIDPGPRVRWYDVDFPDVIELRRKLYSEREGYHQIGSSVTDLTWLDTIPAGTPVFVVAEGLSMYLHKEDGAALFRRITDQFPSGQIAFDAYSGAMVRLVSWLATVRGAKVELVWGFDDEHDLEKLVPKVHLAECVEFLMMPELFERLNTSRFRGAMGKLMGRLPFYRHLVRHLRYEF